MYNLGVLIQHYQISQREKSNTYDIKKTLKTGKIVGLIKTLFGDEGVTQNISVLFSLITFNFKAISREHEIGMLIQCIWEECLGLFMIVFL